MGQRRLDMRSAARRCHQEQGAGQRPTDAARGIALQGAQGIGMTIQQGGQLGDGQPGLLAQEAHVLTSQGGGAVTFRGLRQCIGLHQVPCLSLLGDVPVRDMLFDDPRRPPDACLHQVAVWAHQRATAPRNATMVATQMMA